MRLIDADALKEEFPYHPDGGLRSFRGLDRIASIRETIDAAPTVDAIPVARCKNCMWWIKQENSLQGRCALLGIYPTGGWYCANSKTDGGA